LLECCLPAGTAGTERIHLAAMAAAAVAAAGAYVELAVELAVVAAVAAAVFVGVAAVAVPAPSSAAPPAAVVELAEPASLAWNCQWKSAGASAGPLPDKST